jgi:arginase
MSSTTSANTALVGMRCRTSERSGAAARGVDALVGVIGRQLGMDPRLIGSPQPARSQGYAADLAASRGCLLEAGGQVEDALAAGALPLLVATDGAISLTTLPTVARLRPDASVLWLDAHGSFHTPDTTPSGYLGGMALAGACGRWETGFQGSIEPHQIVLCGVRELDDGEREDLEHARVRTIGASLETLVFLQNTLDGAPVYVHLDVDVLDEESMPVSHAVPGGLDEDKLFDLLEAVADSSEVVGVQVTGFEAEDEDDRQALVRAEVIAGVLDPLLP